MHLQGFFTGLHEYIGQLEELDERNQEAEKEVLDDAELEKMGSEQEAETKALEDEAKAIEEAKGNLWRAWKMAHPTPS